MPPVTWTQLQAHRPGRPYPRHPAVNRTYKSITNTTDRVRVDVFGWNMDQKGTAYRPAAGWRRSALVPNKYPYWTESGVHHWLLWSETPMTGAAIQKRLERELPTHQDHLWFVNPEQLRSVPGIWHAHVFWR